MLSWYVHLPSYLTLSSISLHGRCPALPTQGRGSYFSEHTVRKANYVAKEQYAFVCALGIDSRYNEGCSELAKYLFYSLYGRHQPSLEHVLEEFPEDMLDGESTVHQ